MGEKDVCRRREREWRQCNHFYTPRYCCRPDAWLLSSTSSELACLLYPPPVSLLNRNSRFLVLNQNHVHYALLGMCFSGYMVHSKSMELVRSMQLKYFLPRQKLTDPLKTGFAAPFLCSYPPAENRSIPNKTVFLVPPSQRFNVSQSNSKCRLRLMNCLVVWTMIPWFYSDSQCVFKHKVGLWVWTAC